MRTLSTVIVVMLLLFFSFSTESCAILLMIFHIYIVNPWSKFFLSLEEMFCKLCFFQSTRHLFIPADKKIPFIRIETRQAEMLQNKRIIVAIDSWPRDSRNPKVQWLWTLSFCYLKFCFTFSWRDISLSMLLLQVHSRWLDFLNWILISVWMISMQINL